MMTSNEEWDRKWDEAERDMERAYKAKQKRDEAKVRVRAFLSELRRQEIENMTAVNAITSLTNREGYQMFLTVSDLEELIK